MAKPIKYKEQVNHPSHYRGEGGMEAIDAMIGVFGCEEVASWCKITAFKYLTRLGKKDDAVQDARKAAWYINKFIQLTNEDNDQ